MAEIVDTMPQNLANKCAELERKKNLFASTPPRATFGERLQLDHEIAELRRRGRISDNEKSGPKGK